MLSCAAGLGTEFAESSQALLAAYTDWSGLNLPHICEWTFTRKMGIEMLDQGSVHGRGVWDENAALAAQRGIN